MTQNLESLVLDLFCWLERVERFQKLLVLASEQFNESVDDNSQIAEILLDRYIVGVEPCFDEISVLRSTVLKCISSVDSVNS